MSILSQGSQRNSHLFSWERSQRRLLSSLFRIYTAIALIWLILGLLPIAVGVSAPMRTFIFDLGRTLPPLSFQRSLLYGIYFASHSLESLPAIAVQYLFSLANIALGLMLVRLRPQDRVAWLLALGLVGTGAIFNMQSHVLLNYSADPWLNAAHELLHFTSGGAYSFALLLFPTGLLPPSPFPHLHLPYWLDWPLRIALILFIIFFGWGMLGTLHGEPVTFVVFFGVLVPVIGGISQLFRYRRAASEMERQQTRTLLFALLAGAGMATAILGIVGLTAASGIGLSLQVERSLERATFIIFPLLFTAIPIALTFIVLRYRLWEMNIVINRSLIYGTLTALIVVIYVLVVAGVDALLQERLPWIPSALAVGLAAILAQPLREWVQSGVNRLMYGDRDDPFGVLTRLGHRLEATGKAEGVLPTITETVARALKLPYVAVAVKKEESFVQVASYGAPLEAVESFPLIDQGEIVGQLQVARRAPNESFQRADRRLLENLARQAGPAVHAVLLAEALQQSRLRLVTAREEERRRLRRDLHDGLGPQLAALRLNVDAIHNHLHRDAARSEVLLLEVKAQIATAIADIRRTVYGLRPPTLDQLGLVSAIREHVRTLGAQNDLQIRVVGPETLPALPAAIEVAAYHVVVESITNVVKHARASHCYVGICLSGDLHLVVSDDGAGLPDHRRAGVGLASMRERVDELGGAFAISSPPGQGTRVEVSLPLPTETSAIQEITQNESDHGPNPYFDR
ncbi:MAG: GAF domain-containing sensor histidine kinase [Caldilineaceae bacterium]|nr:GAF domain-containing sensor histidine kinase [Caldilineaceae bacterium]